jgi:hypothetical protein
MKEIFNYLPKFYCQITTKHILLSTRHPNTHMIVLINKRSDWFVCSPESFQL